jgi:hypothetical protein
MDEKYFDDLKKVILIQVELNEHPCEIDDSDEWLIEILKQIHHAGFLAAQEKCERAVETIIPGNGILKLRALAAIKAVKEGE